MTDSAPRRTVRVLTRGSMIALGIAGLIWVAAAYLFYAPAQYINATGLAVRCGSASDPATAPLLQAACGDWTQERRWQALALLAAGAVVVIVGLAAYGTVRREQDEEPLGPDRDEPDTIDLADEADAAAGSRDYDDADDADADDAVEAEAEGRAAGPAPARATSSN